MRERAVKRLKGLIGLLTWILIIIAFLFIIGPLFEKLPLFQPIARFIDERGIEANMYFYTEVEEFSDAQINMNHTMDFPPREFSRPTSDE